MKKINISAILCGLLLFLAFLSFFSAKWYSAVFGDVGFDSILYTLTTDFEGVEAGQVIKYLKGAVIPTVVITVLLCLALFAVKRRRLLINIGKKIKIKIFPFSKWFSVCVSIVLSCVFVFLAAINVEMTTYLRYMLSKSSTFIADNYVDPKNVNITFPEQKQNLIIIYLESMETSFLSSEYKGGNDVNPMPELCTLAEQNINFSHNDTVGGFSSLVGGTWTIGAMVSQTAGVPLKTPFLSANEYDSEVFLPGITNLSDILGQNGYYQALMVGSNAIYGGRYQYYVTHGTTTIYDIFTARNSGIVPPDYWVWWGMEDLYLFDYAKTTLQSMAQWSQPFAFTMLTVDTHHVGGYKCSKCGDEYPEQYENVLACSSRQVFEFVQWIKQQDFYENTTIVLCGDHPTMDEGYVSKNLPENYERKVYNCFINSLSDTKNSKNRDFSSMDMFPTVLASIGCSIEGERLGLGTNLFSETPTLCEELGIEELESELSKRSNFYDNNFLKASNASKK